MSQAPSTSSFGEFGLIGSGIAGSAAFGGLAALSARSRSKAIKEAAEEDFKRIGDYITQSRVDRILNTERLAREGQVAVGNALNASPEGLAMLETIASRIVAGVSSDQFAIDEELRRRETAATAEMQNVENRANNTLAEVASSAGSAIGEGFNAGVATYMNIEGYNRDKALAERQEGVFAQQGEMNETQQKILDEQFRQQQLRTKYEIGRYKEMVSGNEALANSAGVRIGLAQVFNKRFGGPDDPFYTWGIGGPAK